jgi:hypothetical protein
MIILLCDGECVKDSILIEGEVECVEESEKGEFVVMKYLYANT